MQDDVHRVLPQAKAHATAANPAVAMATRTPASWPMAPVTAEL